MTLYRKRVTIYWEAGYSHTLYADRAISIENEQGVIALRLGDDCLFTYPAPLIDRIEVASL